MKREKTSGFQQLHADGLFVLVYEQPLAPYSMGVQHRGHPRSQLESRSSTASAAGAERAPTAATRESIWNRKSEGVRRDAGRPACMTDGERIGEELEAILPGSAHSNISELTPRNRDLHNTPRGERIVRLAATC